MNVAAVVIRKCQGLEELSACVQLQIDVWGYGDRDVVPRRVFVVGEKIGGQAIGAFVGPTLIGFAMALPGISAGQIYLHSHMLAVDPAYRNQGIGRRLKLFQRREALSRGIRRMEWTFDPLEIKNAYLNLAKLGAVVRRYFPNFYGVTSSPLHGAVPTDRLCAEWWLDSDWVGAALAQGPRVYPLLEQEIFVPHEITQWKQSSQGHAQILALQTANREQFQHAFARNLVVVGYKVDANGNGAFQLGRWQQPFDPSPSLQPLETGFDED